MADYHNHFTSQADGALLTTLRRMALDSRITPLERNAWQVLLVLRTPDGLSTLANLTQLRRYLTGTPLGQRAGYETAWRALAVLRLTGWISLVGKNRDPLSGRVLSELYQTHDRSLTFEQACALDPSLPQLLQDCIGHENNQVDRIAIHIRDGHEFTAAEPASDALKDDDDEDPPSSSSQSKESSMAQETPPSANPATEPRVLQQNARACQTMQCHSPTYKELKYKKSTYVPRAQTREATPTRAHESDASLQLPPCLERAAEDQRRDMQTALRRLPRQVGQEVLQELEARHRDGGVRNVVAYLFALIRRVGQGEFRLWAGKRLANQTPQAAQRVSSGEAQASPTAPDHVVPAFKPASPEVVRSSLDKIRSMLHMPVRVGDLAAELMQSDHWKPGTA
ncbi:STY4528 family pathogenicity island replication protein [Pseudomonas chlororaphis subsp. aureofaciens]|uniref:STY4528 family pathogenicity island replication protein n=1 Tax=Pseudomonas chlororaphis TaxID=587753 RepID=UPI0035593638